MRWFFFKVIFLIHIVYSMGSVGYAEYKDYYPWMTKEMYTVSKEECKDAELEQSWVLAVMCKESGFFPYAISCAGALGLMQAMPFHFTCDDCFETRVNIKTGCKVLKSALRKARGDYRFALVYYHAGENKDPTKYKYWRTYVYEIEQMKKESVREE